MKIINGHPELEDNWAAWEEYVNEEIKKSGLIIENLFWYDHKTQFAIYKSVKGDFKHYSKVGKNWNFCAQEMKGIYKNFIEWRKRTKKTYQEFFNMHDDPFFEDPIMEEYETKLAGEESKTKEAKTNKTPMVTNSFVNPTFILKAKIMEEDNYWNYYFGFFCLNKGIERGNIAIIRLEYADGTEVEFETDGEVYLMNGEGKTIEKLN